ncbi:L-threonylcarbamoyladenylate synthase [Parablautia muri]|uniref:Threonylcarbamoyl-AMP synthase n=1 Tax=Parablautia muri TaxID=2320879 RepID=A0A9X5BGQ8_9FIRM|nr:L-threonylcarbamoyladenylate synthase [Parablautia muri]NBJ93705.1 threonylcarbamoyl-AMP synthase [Parablautia muri]
MNTEIIKIDEENMDMQAIGRAGEIIKTGGLVAFPTETVYGLGGDALNAASSEKIYVAKGRPSDNPLIVHIAKLEELSFLVREVPEVAYKLAEKFWPGPLTMIFHKSKEVPAKTTGGLETVAVRMPSNKVAKAFIEAAGGYVAAPSANRSGRPSPTVAKYVIEDLDGRVEMILDGGEAVIGLESTIIDLTEEKPVILRPGYVTEEMLESVIKNVEVDRAIIDEACYKAPKAPGMKYRHYAPKGDLTIVEGQAQQVEAYINEQLKECKTEGKKTGVIATDETAMHYQADSVKSAGGRNEKEQIAKHLFRILREFDDEDVQVIYAESFEKQGVGAAIMNRLLKAAGHRIVSLDQDKNKV